MKILGIFKIIVYREVEYERFIGEIIGLFLCISYDCFEKCYYYFQSKYYFYVRVIVLYVKYRYREFIIFNKNGYLF